MNLAAALRAAGQTDQAISAYQQALRADPNHPQAQYTLGGMLKQRGLPTQALQHFRVALKLNPDRFGFISGIARHQHTESRKKAANRGICPIAAA